MSYLIFISIVVSFLNAFLPFISQGITRIIRKYKPYNKLLKEIEDMKHRLSEISIKEEFARYSKLQRVLNKKQEEFKSKVRGRRAFLLMIKLGVQYVLQGILTLASLFLFWSQRYTPVIILEENWLQPFGSVLSWPTHTPGALSFPLWFLVSNTVAKIASIPFK